MNFGVPVSTLGTESPLARRLSGGESRIPATMRWGLPRLTVLSLFAERVRGLGDSSVLNTLQGGCFLYPTPPLSLPCPYCDEVGMVTNGDELDESECWACHVEDEPEGEAKERAEYAACAS